MALLKNLFGRIAGSAPAASQSPQASGAATFREKGAAALAAGDFARAGEWFAKAAAADPADSLARMNLGFILLESGDAAGAEKQLVDALALRRGDQKILHEIHYFLGRALRAQGANERALESFEAALEAVPSFAEPLEEIVQLLHESGRHAQALERARQLLSIRPSIDSGLMVAQQLHHLGRDGEALAVLDSIVQQEPGHAAAWTGRGNVLAAMGRDAEAVVAFERVLAILGPVPDALANSAAALARAGRLDDALQRAGEALRLEPGHHEALRNRLNVLLQQVRVDEAIETARHAIARWPQDADSHWNLAIACLLAGRFEEGWREHEWRWRASASRARHPLTSSGKQWTGAEDLRGRTILLFAEQGFGDTIQMLRYVPMVVSRGARVMLNLPFGLHGALLVRDLLAGVTLVAPGDPLPAFDYYCPLMSLPLAFGSDEATLPRAVPYLRADPARVEQWRRRLECAGSRLKVGLVWFGNASHANDANRSIALAQLRELRADSCFFVSLQQQMREGDRAALEDWRDLHRWGEELVDFDDTAALVQALDVVVSVDTSVAHLAGALGRPVWLLLPHSPDWRWMVDRTDSPWYPTARLFRQARRQEWGPVLEAVQSELRASAALQTARADREAVIPSRPSWPELLEQAQGRFSQGAHAAALAALDAADAQAGPHPLTGHLRGNVLFELGRYEEAAQAFDAAAARKSGFVEAIANAAAAWLRAGRAAQSFDRAEAALRLKPGHVQSITTRMNALQSLGRHVEALAAAREAHQLYPGDPELEWTYGAYALLYGDYERGWAPLESRWQLPGAGKKPDAAELGCPAWTGAEPLEGRTILLLSEQGFGDTLQFVRYVPGLLRRGARVVVRVQEALRELIAQSLPECIVITRVEGAPRADFHIPLMGLPLAVGTRLETIPAQVPYLRIPARHISKWRARMPQSGKMRVGVAWSGNPNHTNDRNRSIPLAALLRAMVPGVEFVSLQRDVREADEETLLTSGILDLREELHSFADTAALVVTLDLVICVDTSVAHLAGALGRPLWVMLTHRPDWRWMVDREDSPWYPTARLFRQPAPGAWEPLVETLRSALAEFAATRPASA
jgi:tetratricopeptide (TPR) repeat protein